MWRAADAHESSAAFVLSLDRGAQDVVSGSGVLDGSAAGHLAITTDAADSRDGRCLVVPPEPEPAPEAELSLVEGERSSTAAALRAAVRDYEHIRDRARRDLMELVERRRADGDHVREARLYVVAGLGQRSGAGLLLPALLLGQQLRDELARDGVALGRYVLLVLPPPVDDLYLPEHRRADAALVTLHLAASAGLTLAGDRLRAPVAESVVVVGNRHYARPNVQRQVRDGADVLRVLADEGPLGDHVRFQLRQSADPEGLRLFQLVGTSAVAFRPARLAPALARMAIAADARRRVPERQTTFPPCDTPGSRRGDGEERP